jgi:hypothetical protein
VRRRRPKEGVCVEISGYNRGDGVGDGKEKKRVKRVCVRENVVIEVEYPEMKG